jgi:hypothetical protein
MTHAGTKEQTHELVAVSVAEEMVDPNTGSEITASDGGDISPEQRSQMIAEAAYYLAEHRGFNGGSPEQDWFSAEAEIARRLNEKSTWPTH